MGQARLPVRKIREVLRLKADGFSDRQVAHAIGSSRSTVQECVRRAREAGLSWPLPEEIDEAGLHAQLYRRAVPLSRTPQPEFAYLHRELSRRGVTRLLLWEVPCPLVRHANVPRACADLLRLCHFKRYKRAADRCELLPFW